MVARTVRTSWLFVALLETLVTCPSGQEMAESEKGEVSDNSSAGVSTTTTEFAFDSFRMKSAAVPCAQTRDNK